MASMTELIVDISVRPGETLTQRIAQIIAIPDVRTRQERGVIHVLRGMRTQPQDNRPDAYRITFSYEALEEDAVTVR